MCQQEGISPTVLEWQAQEISLSISAVVYLQFPIRLFIAMMVLPCILWLLRQMYQSQAIQFIMQMMGENTPRVLPQHRSPACNFSCWTSLFSSLLKGAKDLIAPGYCGRSFWRFNCLLPSCRTGGTEQFPSGNLCGLAVHCASNALSISAIASIADSRIRGSDNG